MNQLQIKKIVDEVVSQFAAPKNVTSNSEFTDGIPIAVSARHIHLQQEHVEILFGRDAVLTKYKNLSQPNQFAANETLTIVGPKGCIQKVRVLGPTRKLTQVEVSFTDALKLGINPPLRESGDIEGSASCTLVGPKGSIYLKEGVILAQAHIHMSPLDAQNFNVKDGEFVSIGVKQDRPVMFQQVKIRVSDKYRLEMHIDTDEANAGLIQQGTIGKLYKNDCSENIDSEYKLSTQLSFPDQRVITAYDIQNVKGKNIRIHSKTIVTDRAREIAKQLGITILYDEE